MATKKTEKSAPIIEMIPVADLQIEEGFNVRSAKSFKANADELEKIVEAEGFLDGTKHAVQYIERDGKKLIRGGHTIHEVARRLGYKTVPACVTEMDAVQEQVNLVTSNAGHPLTPYEQGEVYRRLRAGSTNEEVGQEVREPMTTKDIANRVGFSEQHIKNCIAIRESSPEIGALIEDGVVSAGVVVRVQQLVKEPGKQLSFLKAALSSAKTEGKEVATMKHLEAVKDKFVKLKAVAPKSEPTPPAAEQQDAEPEGAPESEQPESQSEPKPREEQADLPGAQPEAPAPAAQHSKESSKNSRSMLTTVINEWAEECEVAFGDGDLDNLLDRIEAAKIPF